MQKLKFLLLTKSLGLYINLLSFVAPGKSKQVAYRWFSKPRDGKLRPDALPDMLAAARRETIALADDLIQTYTWAGSATTILLAHGWDSNSWRWERLLPFLVRSGSTVVAIDAPDHGLSRGDFSLPKYAAFLNAACAKYRPDYLIGHSIGAAASLYFQHAYRNPHIKKLVMLGAPAELSSILHNYRGLLSLSERSVALLNEHFVEQFQFHPDDFSARKFSKGLEIKGLVAHDTHDEVVLFDEATTIPENWEQAVFIKTEGLGHSMHDDELYDRIATFLFED